MKKGTPFEEVKKGAPLRFCYLKVFLIRLSLSLAELLIVKTFVYKVLKYHQKINITSANTWQGAYTFLKSDIAKVRPSSIRAKLRKVKMERASPLPQTFGERTFQYAVDDEIDIGGDNIRSHTGLCSLDKECS